MKLYISTAYTAAWLLVFNTALAKFNWGSEWTNSGFDEWPMYIEPTGKVTGHYQLNCQDARKKSEWKEHLDLLDKCETSCRCNAWGEYLLNPMASEYCTSNAILVHCVQVAGCKCTWVVDAAWGPAPIPEGPVRPKLIQQDGIMPKDNTGDNSEVNHQPDSVDVPAGHDELRKRKVRKSIS